MNAFIRQFSRRKLFTALLTLLLAAAVALFSIGFSAWQNMMDQAAGINDQYTTIAIPMAMDQEDKIVLSLEEQQRLYGGDRTDDQLDRDAVALNAPQLLSVDRQCLLGAHVEGMRALSSGALDPLQYVYEFDSYCYAFSVLAAKCVSIKDYPTFPQEIDGMLVQGTFQFSAMFEFVDAVSRLDAYDLPYGDAEIEIFGSYYNPDGSNPFEVGKTYLLRGFYVDYNIRSGLSEEDNTVIKYRWDPDHGRPESFHFFYLDDLVFLRSPQFAFVSSQPDEENMCYHYPAEGGLPFWAEYTGDWREFLNSEEGRVWREKIIPLCEVNHHSATVVLTDSLQSMYAFNTGSALMLEGREFTSAEYIGGAPVCLVSAAYAQFNHLQVGDTLNLEFYNPGYAARDMIQSGVIFASEGVTVCRFPMVPESRTGVRGDYTIVGIYTAPEFSMGVHNFHADTIFVPKASVPNAAQYEDSNSDYLNTYVLENGTAEAFEAHMAEQGYGGMFAYFDQNFGDLVEAMESLRSNALRLLVLGGAALLVAMVLFLFLSLRQLGPTARGMRLLGVCGMQVWRELLGALGVVIAAASALGAALGAVLYGRVTAAALSQALVLRPGVLLACAGGAAVLLLAVAAACALPVVRRQLMNPAGKKRRGQGVV